MKADIENDGGPGATQGSGEPFLQVRPGLPAVTRINRRAVLVLCALGAFVGLMVLVFGFGSHGASRRDGTTDENAIRPAGPVESVKDLPSDYTFDVNQAAQGVTYNGIFYGSQGTTRPSGPSAQDQAIAEELRELAELRRRLLEEQLKEQQEALDSPLIFSGAKSPENAVVEIPTTLPAGTWDQQVHNPGSNLQTSGDQNESEDRGASENHQRDKEAFLTQAATVEPYLTKPLLEPISPYEIKAGTVISGALLTAINTDLPGEVIGQVTENVYDSATGKYLLIPQGSRLLGKYQSLVTNGQSRALIVWQRLIFPNGNSIVLDGMPGTDEAGMAGLQDQVDYHLDKLAEATALSTAIAYAGNLARDPQSGSGYTGSDVIGDAVAQQANQVGENIINRQLDVQPTITIRQGWPFRVLVNMDMVLEPYQP